MWVFVAIALVFSALFVRLGAWQLERLQVRRNESLAASERLARPAVDLNVWLAHQQGSASEYGDKTWRPVTLSGRPDYENEIVLRGHSQDGVPGVRVATPVLLDYGPGDAPDASPSAPDPGAERPAAVVVIRGWLPAPDAMRANLSAARPGVGAPPETVYVTGLVVPAAERHTIPPLRIDFGGEEHTVLAAPDLSDIRDALPYSVAPLLVQRAERGARGANSLEPGSSEPGWSSPAVVAAPVFDDGPHLMYAVQWFAFAAISLVGGVTFLLRGR